MTAKVQWTDAEVLAILWAHRALGLTSAQIAFQHGVTRNAVVGLVHRVEASLGEAEIAALPDDLVLAVLDGFEGKGRSAEALARHLSGRAKEFAPPGSPGLTRNGVLLLLHRVRLELAQAGPCQCAVAENRSGGMPRCWWEAGLWQRRVAA